MTRKFLRYLITASYLRLSQVLWRLYKNINLVPVLNDRAPTRRSPLGLWRAGRRKSPHRCGMIFTFIGLSFDLNKYGWNSKYLPLLWTFNLHYFDDLVCAGYENRQELHATLVERWMSDNPVGRGVGWHPYPTSIRIVNWIKWSLTGIRTPSGFTESIAMQTRWLNRRVEYDLLANHVIANAKALVFSGLYFSGAEADSWLGRGLKLLKREMKEQILEDGGHFERSPMYHAIILEDLLDVIAIGRHFPGKIDVETEHELLTASEKMLSWLEKMTHQNGEISHFNDSVDGVALTLSDLIEYFCTLHEKNLASSYAATETLSLLESSGFARLELGPFTVLIDVGSVGPSYQPGHSHAGTLSIEVDVFGHRLIVNTGVTTYETGKVRSYERSTAAHSTVVINEKNSSDVWSSFRVGTRARIVSLKAGKNAKECYLNASHDGYSNLLNSVIHRRELSLTETSLTINDRVFGPAKSLVSHIHFHPLVELKERNASQYDFHIKNTEVRGEISFFNASTKSSDGYFSKKFGEISQSHKIEATFSECIRLEINVL